MCLLDDVLGPSHVLTQFNPHKNFMKQLPLLSPTLQMRKLRQRKASQKLSKNKLSSMFKGLEKVRSLSKNLYLWRNTYALKLKRNITYFNFRMHRGYKSMMEVVAERLEVVVVVAESLCVEGSHFPFQKPQLNSVQFVPIDIGWRRQWHPTPLLLPGKSHGWRSLVGCSPWGRTESDTTEQLSSRVIGLTS